MLEEFFRERALLLQRLGAFELIRLEVDIGFLSGERGFGLRDLRLQQGVVELGHRLALLHPVALIHIDGGDAIARKFGTDGGLLTHDETAGGDDFICKIAQFDAGHSHRLGLARSRSGLGRSSGDLFGRRRFLAAGVQREHHDACAGNGGGGREILARDHLCPSLRIRGGGSGVAIVRVRWRLDLSSRSNDA